MASFKSTQATTIDSPDHTQLKPNEAHGRKRTAFFDFVTPAGMAVADTLDLNEVPIGARIIGGNIAFGALGASATIGVGYAGAATRYKAQTAAATAGNFDIARTLAENYGDELTARQRLIITFAGANPTSGITIKGHVDYVVD